MGRGLMGVKGGRGERERGEGGRGCPRFSQVGDGKLPRGSLPGGRLLEMKKEKDGDEKGGWRCRRRMEMKEEEDEGGEGGGWR